MSIESDIFEAHVPRRLQRAMLKAVVDGCGLAFDAARARKASDWFNDAIPAYRRLEVEPLLQQLLLPKGFTSSLRRSTSTKHTRIESDKVVITALTRSIPRSWVRPDRYRKTLARKAQLFLRGLYRDEPIEEGAKLFALLMYGGAHSRRIPNLAQIVFPTTDGTFAPGTINLLEAFPEMVAPHEAKTPELEVSLLPVQREEDEDA